MIFFGKWWEWVIFLEKWVGASRFCQKMSGSVLFFLENGWEWVTLVGSDWESVRVAGSRRERNSEEPSSNCWNRFGMEYAVWDVFMYLCFVNVSRVANQWKSLNNDISHKKKEMDSRNTQEKKFQNHETLTKANNGTRPTKFSTFNIKNRFEYVWLQRLNLPATVFKNELLSTTLPTGNFSYITERKIKNGNFSYVTEWKIKSLLLKLWE